MLDVIEPAHSARAHCKKIFGIQQPAAIRPPYDPIISARWQTIRMFPLAVRPINTCVNLVLNFFVALSSRLSITMALLWEVGTPVWSKRHLRGPATGGFGLSAGSFTSFSAAPYGISALP